MRMLVFSDIFRQDIRSVLLLSHFRWVNYKVGKIIDQVSDVLWSKLSSKPLTGLDHDRFLYIVVKFREKWSFCNVIGCIDGEHVCCKCPTKFGSLFYNYKLFFLVVLQGVTDSESIFIFIDVGAYGKQSDGGTFSASTLYNFLGDFESTLPKPASFEGSGIEMPFVVLGDEAYPLKMYLMKPFARKHLSCEEHAFNYRLSWARWCVECAFGILIAKWWLLNTAIELNVSKGVFFYCITSL